MPSTSDTALRLKSLLSEISPIIEEYTARVCPACIDVCCRQKHGQYLDRDVRYLAALGVAIPETDAARPPEGPCGFLGPSGCVHPRWLRPWKCTWFFCGPLLAALDDGPQRTARRLSATMQEIMGLYDSVG